MTSPAIDSLQTPMRSATGGRTLGGIATVLKVVLGATGLAGVAAGAVWLVSDPAEPSPRSEVRLAKVEAWPEIKDGVPALAPALPAAQGQATSPPAAVEPVPAPAQAAPDFSQRTTGAAQPETPREIGVPETTEPITTLAPPIPPPAPRRTVQDKASVQDKATVQDKAKPRKEQAARPQSQRTAAVRPKPEPKQEITPPAPPKEEAKAAAPPDDRIRVFGVPLPTGRDIKETFESIGDAVLGRSSRS